MRRKNVWQAYTVELIRKCQPVLCLWYDTRMKEYYMDSIIVARKERIEECKAIGSMLTMPQIVYVCGHEGPLISTD